jgi:hypothetical protein
MQNDTRIAVDLAKTGFEIAVSRPDRLREWANKLATTHVHNKAAVAVANKMARVV